MHSRSDAPSVAAVGAGNSACLSVCFRCKPENWRGSDDVRPGHQLADAIEREAMARDNMPVMLRDVRCLSQCRRPCVVAFSGVDRFTYLFGDLDPLHHARSILDAFTLYRSRTDGFMERFERPEPLRAGILGRIPPLAQTARLVEPRALRRAKPELSLSP
ncbi:MAG: DUF1636 family protein [Beijerinckiaceae bacterium]